MTTINKHLTFDIFFVTYHGSARIPRFTVSDYGSWPNLPDYDVLPSEIKNKTWSNISYACFCDTVNDVYDEIVHYRRNIFNVPSGRAGKSFIEELTFWIKQFNSGSDLISVALKAFMVLPTLILQKPSATSKCKEHSEAIEGRLALWK